MRSAIDGIAGKVILLPYHNSGTKQSHH